MPKKLINMKDFGKEQAERIGIYRAMHFGTKRPANPRHLPDFRKACVLINGSNLRELGRRLNGDSSCMSNGLIRKLINFDLMDRYSGVSKDGESIGVYVPNAHGIELICRGKVDTTKQPSKAALHAYDTIAKSQTVSRNLSNGMDLKQRNSTVGVSEIGFDTGAESIGVFMCSAGFMATAYDQHGIRVTDIFIQDFEPGDRDWKMRWIDDDNEYPIKDYDLIPANKFAEVLKVPVSKIFYDEKLQHDIWNCESFDYPGKICVNPHLANASSYGRR